MGIFSPCSFLHGDHKALNAICPIYITPVTIRLFLKIFMFFNENITTDKLAHVLNRR